MMRGLFLGMSVEFLEINGFGIGGIGKFPSPEMDTAEPGKVTGIALNIHEHRVGMLGQWPEFITT